MAPAARLVAYKNPKLNLIIQHISRPRNRDLITCREILTCTQIHFQRYGTPSRMLGSGARTVASEFRSITAGLVHTEDVTSG